MGDQGAGTWYQVFEVPAANVKGRKRSRLLICNSVAQSVLESVREQHDEFVFVCG
jgi:hypothetical protein